VTPDFPTDPLFEARVRKLAEELMREVHKPIPITHLREKLTDAVLKLSMQHPELKASLFHFVDVLPSLKDAQDVVLHFQSYLKDSAQNLPLVLRSLLRALNLPVLDILAAGCIRLGVRQMARQFIVGENPDAAMTQLNTLWQSGQSYTADLLGEAAVSLEEADAYGVCYLELMRALAAQSGSDQRVNVSVKCSSLYPSLDPLAFDRSVTEVKKRLRPIFQEALRLGIFVNLDMEQNDFRGIILQVTEDLLTELEFKNYPHFGVVVQAYLRAASSDLTRLEMLAKKRGTPLTVRLVKGAYWDYEVIQARLRGQEPPVFLEKSHTDANFELCTRQLLAATPHLQAAFGTHNLRSAAHAVIAAEGQGVDKSDYEFQMLYGMADEAKRVLVARGHHLRVYAPVGDLLPGMAYLVRRLLENSSNESFLQFRSLPLAGALVLLAKPEAVPTLVASEADLSRQKTFNNDPLRDFSCDENRAWIAPALVALRGRLPIKVLPVIDGEEVATQDFLMRENPSLKSETVARCGLATLDQAQAAIEASRGARKTWGHQSAGERAQVISQAATLLEAQRNELIALMVLETGKSVREAEADFCEAVDFCRYYAEQMTQLSTRQGAASLPGEHNDYEYRPRGLTAVIAPWNFPLAILCGMTVAALVSGNPVIMKPAEQSSAVAQALYQILRASGVPPEALQFLPGKGEDVGRYLVTHAEVHVIAFTGSKAVGLEIMRQASLLAPGQAHIKKVIAEMGGKNAVIVDSDADLDEAVVSCLASAFSYQGQKCSALSRVIVLKPVFERFRERLVAALQTLTLGPADDLGAHIGAVIDAETQRRLLSVIESQQAKIVTQLPIPQHLLNLGHFVPPTVFLETDPHAVLMQQEFFGPLLTLFCAEDFAHALAVINQTEYALTAGLFSRNPAHIAQARLEIEAGNLYINRGITGALVGRQPFGGFKLSGVGAKAGGPDYLLQFLEPVCVTENTMRRGFVAEEPKNCSDRLER
jgi:RHH-type proline utilization regulon transcriptional repressor/proline dehydrogenase/delta 1-pyrroline-5-carboxylate dehydrogenase